MITALLVALVYIAIISVIGWAIVTLVPGIPPQVATIIWVIIAIVDLLILLSVVTGHHVMGPLL